jgi:hypothetical protein
MEKSSFTPILIFLLILSCINSTQSWNGQAVSCTDDSGINQYNAAPGSLQTFVPTKVLEGADANIKSEGTQFSTIFFRYFT